MEEIINNLSSPAWWVTAILAGVAASLFAAYAKPLLDKFGSKISSSLRGRNELKKQEFDEKVSSLRGCIDKQLLESVEVNYLRLRGINFFLMAIALLIIFSFSVSMLPKFMYIGLGVLTMVFMLSSFFDILAAQKLKSIINASRS